MHLDFWFDPICPFCWETSRWVNRVAPHRNLSVTWKPISLLFKNEMGADNPFYERAAHTRDLLRVVEAVRADGQGDRIGALYTELGRRIHNRGETDFDVADALAAADLDRSFAAALTEERWDDAIRASMEEGLALTGPDVGTPLIALDDGAGGRVGFFGPVIIELPELEASLELFDGFLRMVRTPGFFELKRTRTDRPTPPDEAVLNAEPAPPPRPAGPLRGYGRPSRARASASTVVPSKKRGLPPPKKRTAFSNANRRKSSGAISPSSTSS